MLTQEQDKLARALEVGFVVVDASQPGHPLTFVSDGFVHLTGYSREEALGRGLGLLIGPESDALAVAEMRQAVQHREARTLELLNYRKDGTKFWNLLGLAPLPEGNGAVVRMVGVVRNVTQLREHQREREREQRMAALGELAGGIAHDFNNLLGVVLGNCALIEQALTAQGSDPAALRAVRLAAQRGTDQVRRLLTLTKAPMLDLRPVDLEAVRHELLLMLRSVLKFDVSIDFRIEPDARWVLGDETQLHGALLNLILNARQALPAGGRIAVSARPDTGAAVPRVLVAVRDNGLGMSAEVRQRMFDPFFTTRLPGKGHGLGLAMVHSYVTATGGEIAVDSTLGQGTCVVLKLPLAPGPARPPAPQAVARPGLRRRSAQVLLVEDDELLRLTIGAMLRALGHTAIEVANGTDALARLRSDAGIDLLCTDHFLGEGRTGADLCAEARRLRPGLPTLLMSGWTQETPGEVRHDPFLAKPFTIEALDEALTRALKAAPTPQAAWVRA